MAKVSLRIYNREIESMVEQGRIEEAVAHCNHILKIFPKHLETYRLLGKAYLEAKRYNDAADIFQRVLMAVPDDFVSHVGMSLIRDENGSLDEAIWHMERAFEAQPSNAAVQGELQRLYGRRDGVQPPKIRMTRGALAHMYVQGELYPQAIGEIQGVLAEDPGRVDMQVLLAQAYFRSGQRVESSEICSTLLKKYPYCLDANRILVEILPETSRAESTQVYRHRVNALDPYAAFAKDSIFLSAEVPDAAVNLERLEWKPGQDVGLGTDWGSTLGIKLDKESEPQPDWLVSDASEPEPEPAAPQEAIPAAEDIPEWMRAAGWSESDGAAQEGPVDFSADTEEAAEEIARADIPDWVKSMAPTGAALEAGSPADPAGTGESMPDQTSPAEETPDWLDDLRQEQDEGAEQPQETPVPESAPDEAAASIGDLGTQPEDQDAAMNWLEGLAAKQGAKAEELITKPEDRTESAPEWVEQAKDAASGEAPAPSDETPSDEAPTTAEPALPAESVIGDLGTQPEDQDAAMNWLENLAAKQGAKAEELITKPEDRTESAPEWVQKAQTMADDALAPAEEPVVAESETPASAPADETPVADEDGLQDWGASDDVEAPVPDSAVPQQSEPEAEPAVPAAETSPEAEAQTDEESLVPSWLKDLEASSDEPEQAAPVEETPAPVDETGELPTWLHDLAAPSDEVKPGSVEDELPAWLQEEETMPPEPQPTQPSEWQPLDEVEKTEPTEPTPEEQPAAGAEPVSEPPAPPRPTKVRSMRMATSVLRDLTLSDAQTALQEGDIPAALQEYGKLIKKARLLEETIHDLREALYRYPVDISIWQALGDAYMRANRLQDALDAYTKAEELLR
ncbi:MAG: tetratricopeptide repeat protein [Chloroflexi bacterium]|nr:tetratricopeptide repeat protein [Chloroflexota bacterium]